MDPLGRVGAEERAIPVLEFHNAQLPSNIDIAYIESGLDNRQKLVLLHSFPASSAQFKTLIPRLATHYHVIAPDLPSFGFTKTPANYEPTFANMAKVIAEFLKQLNVSSAAFYATGYGADVAFRLALDNSSLVKALVIQNGNAYEDGLGPAWEPIQKWWSGDGALRVALFHELGKEDWTKKRWTEGVPEQQLPKVDPTQYVDAYHTTLASASGRDTQFKLLWDYQENLKLYPKIQEWLRKNTPLLVLWGEGDPVYTVNGANAYQKDAKFAKIVVMEGGHFLIETKVPIIAREVRDFLEGISS